tara:strand:- start:2873 stop:3757 length:885 start_codon:yes stop_codon:yes gene_type:complete
MTVRTGFTHNTSINDQALIDKLVVESIQVAGFDVHYLPRTSNNIDTIFEDAERSSFDDSYQIEMYFSDNSTGGFGGEGDLISRFGLEVRDSVELVVSLSRFDTVIGTPATLSRPREGDLIYFPFASTLYEITFVEDQVPFFQLGSNYIYQLSCSLFQYADEEFDTGVGTIDAIETALSYQINLTLTDTSGNFTNTYMVYQGDSYAEATAKAEIVEWAVGTGILRIMNIQGLFKTGTSPTNPLKEYNSSTTTDTGIVGYISTVADQNTTTSQSTEFEALKTSIVDFSENNPFGDF